MLSFIPSIVKKQIVAVSGAGMVGFVFAHLAGNFAIFRGADAFNAVAQFYKDLGPLLYAAEIGLIVLFLTHTVLTASLTYENIKARKTGYKKYADHTEGKPTFAARTMPITGIILFTYIIYHLIDFKFAEHTGVIGGVDQGLYGLVVLGLKDPFHAGIYVFSMFALGLHLSHSVQSMCQTFGLVSKVGLPRLIQISQAIGLFIAVAYSSIPIYILAVL